MASLNYSSAANFFMAVYKQLQARPAWPGAFANCTDALRARNHRKAESARPNAQCVLLSHMVLLASGAEPKIEGRGTTPATAPETHDSCGEAYIVRRARLSYLRRSLSLLECRRSVNPPSRSFIATPVRSLRRRSAAYSRPCSSAAQSTCADTWTMVPGCSL